MGSEEEVELVTWAALEASDPEHCQKMLESREEMCSRAWPEFLNQAAVVERIDAVEAAFPETQLVFMEREARGFLAAASGVPLLWTRPFEELPEGGWDWAIEEALRQREAGLNPNCLCMLEIELNPAYAESHDSTLLLKMMKARFFGVFDFGIGPLRPPGKHRYPTTDIAQYLSWSNREGKAFDPWLRTHLERGGHLIGPCRKSLTLRAPVADWERWTGLRLPGDGDYVIPKGLNVLSVSGGVGEYVEPNVWVHHPFG